MLLNLRSALAIGTVTLMGIIAPNTYFALRVQCYPMNSNVLMTHTLNVVEPILKCSNKTESKDYSVFLVFKVAEGGRQQNPDLKVIDNNTKETKWEGAGGVNFWSDWAIQIFQDRNDKNIEKTSLRVPKSGTKFVLSSTSEIPCEITQLQLKKDKYGVTGCAGSFLKGTKMQLKLEESNITLSSDSKFDWKEEFKQKAVFCTS